MSLCWHCFLLICRWLYSLCVCVCVWVLFSVLPQRELLLLLALIYILMSIISIPCVPICSGGWWQEEREGLMAAVDAFDVPHRLCTLFTVNINQLLATPNVFNFVDNKVSMVAKATAKQHQLQRNISRHYVPRIDIYLYCLVVGCYIFVQHLFVCFFISNVKNFSCCCCCFC